MIIGSRILRVVPGSILDIGDTPLTTVFMMDVECPVTKRRAHLYVGSIDPCSPRDTEEILGLIMTAVGVASGRVVDDSDGEAKVLFDRPEPERN